MIDLSLLELSVVTANSDAKAAIENTVKAAQQAEKLGYKRVWLAEHHNMPNIASSATAVLIGHVAEKTQSIRIGSGGIMLPNHSPLLVAEQFGTLDLMYPNRIDLGLGRAPGTDQLTAYAIRKENIHASFSFPEDIKALQGYFGNIDENTKVRAFPGEGSKVPLWILGSSTDSAYLAASLGLPYAFAAHFAPQQLFQAVAIYRKNFRPSAVLEKSRMLVCANIIAADTDKEAELLSTSLYRMFLGIITNHRQPLQPPQPIPEAYKNHPEIRQMADNMLAGTFIGSKATIKKSLGDFIEKTGLDELMTTAYLYDFDDKVKSLRILSEAVQELN